MTAEILNFTEESGPVDEGSTPNLFLLFEEGDSGSLAAASFTSLDVTQSFEGVAFARDDEDISSSIVDAERIPFEDGDQLPAYGDTIQGATSGAEGTFLTARVTNGSFEDGDAQGYLYVKSVSGTFAASESLNISGGSSGIATTTALTRECAVAVVKMTTTDTTWQGESNTDGKERHYLFFTWGWSDVDGTPRTGSQLGFYEVQALPSTVLRW